MGQKMVMVLKSRLHGVSDTLIKMKKRGCWLTCGREREGRSSGAFTAVKQMCFQEVFRFATSCMVLPHLQVEPLQVYGVLLSVEERAADTLFPHA